MQEKGNTSKSRLAVDREFMYIGSAGQAAGRKAGRADGRVEGAFWSASTDFYCENEKRVQTRCKIDCFFGVFETSDLASTDFYCSKINF